MPLVRHKPKLHPEAVYNVKDVCGILEVDPKTLRTYRALGYITPINEFSNRPLFTGRAVMLCHDMAKKR